MNEINFDETTFLLALNFFPCESFVGETIFIKSKKRKASFDKQFDQDMVLILFMMDVLQNIVLDMILPGPDIDWIVLAMFLVS